tara:strand:- start:4742 stop:7147 length:2406 start_codon:yes stop_codon:yes gene_type:complete
LADPQEEKPPRSAQELLDLWNAALNPPYAPSRVGDLTFESELLEERNELVDRLLTTQNTEDKEALLADIAFIDTNTEVDSNFDSIELDPVRVYSMAEILDIQTEKANRTFTKYEEKNINDISKLLAEITDDVLKDWEQNDIDGTWADARTTVSENLFYNWELDFRGRAALTDRVDRGETIADTYAFARLDAYSAELASSPNTLLNNDKFWTAIDAAVDIGYYPPEVKTLLEGNIVKNEEAETILRAFDIEYNPQFDESRGTTGVIGTIMKLDELAAEFTGEMNDAVQATKLDAQLSGNVKVYYENLPSDVDAPEIYPRFGESLRQDQAQFRRFQDSDWDFTENIQTNITRLLNEEDKVFDGEPFSFDPSSFLFPNVFMDVTGEDHKGDIKAALRLWRRDLINQINKTEAAKRYNKALEDKTKNPTIKMAADLFNMYDAATGEDNQTIVNEVVNKLNNEKQNRETERLRKEEEDRLEKEAADAERARREGEEAIAEYREKQELVSGREKQAQIYLEQDPRYRALLEDPVGGKLFLRAVADNVRDFDSFDDLMASEDFETEVAFLAERFDPGAPPGFPGMPGVPGLIVREPPPPPKDFNFDLMNPQLVEIAMERPEFAEFLSNQMALPGFNEEFRKVSTPQLDEERYLATISGGPQEGTEAYELQERRLESFQRQYTEAINRGLDEEETQEAVRRLEEAEEQFRRETGADPTTRERPAVDAAFMPGGFAREAARQQFTTPAQTSRQFFESRLPGFEERYKESPFFRLEQERKEQEEEQEQKERRKPILRTGGRGRTIVTRGRA